MEPISGTDVGTKVGTMLSKNVKLSKRCQMSKKQTPRLWRRFTKKFFWHNEIHRYWRQIWCHIWSSLKPLKMSLESIFDQFWWPLYLMSKLTSIFVNIIVSIYFFYNYIFLTSFWQLDIFWHFNRTSTPSQEKYSFITITPSQREIFSQITKEGTSPWPGCIPSPQKGNYLPKSV